MAVNNSLVKKNKAQQNLGITAYLTQDAIKNQINQVEWTAFHFCNRISI